MDSSEIYPWLMSSASGGACDGFDAHVIASVLSLAAFEGKGDAAALVEGVGLEPAPLLSLIADVFPLAIAAFERVVSNEVSLLVQADEACLREYLGRHASGGKLSVSLAVIIARRALRPHHLWQDLGLRNRRELSWLMERHFERLAARNVHDMKWKKYLYRAICRDDGFALCVAPSCSECSDFHHCFGDESGESLLARESIAIASSAH